MKSSDYGATSRIGRIIAFPKNGLSYNECFYRCVEQQNVVVIEGMFTFGWLRDNLRAADWVHLHWPSFDYNIKGGRTKRLLAFARWVVLMTFVRIRRARIVWTAHNLLPHDRSTIPRLDLLGRHLVIALSSRILVHGAHAAECVTDRFPAAAGKLCIIPHGNWVDYYPRSLSRETARIKLGIRQDQFVFLFIGLCKPYKNLDGLVRAFHDLPGHAVLLIAGKFQDEAYYEQIKKMSLSDSRIKLHAGFIPDEMVQAYALACDAVVLPYREVLTSGTAMLALSFGRPVLSVALGFLKDVINPNVGILFSPTDPIALFDALVTASSLCFEEEKIIAHARTFSFDEAAKRFVATLRECP